MKKTSQNSLDSIQSSLSRAFPCSVTDVLGVRPTFQLPSEGNAGISLHHETLNASATAGSLSVQRLGATPPKIEMVSCGALPSFIDYDIIFNGLKFGGRYYPSTAGPKFSKGDVPGSTRRVAWGPGNRRRAKTILSVCPGRRHSDFAWRLRSARSWRPWLEVRLARRGWWSERGSSCSRHRGCRTPRLGGGSVAMWTPCDSGAGASRRMGG